MIKAGIVVGSTRPGRKAEDVANWVHGIAQKRGDAEYQVIDIQSFNLPLLDEPLPPSLGKPHQNAHSWAWAETIEARDAFIFVTPEYNHGPSGALKNAIDYLFYPWNNKSCGFVGYGGTGGIRAIEQLRQIVGEVMMADVRNQVGLSLRTDWEQYTVFKPGAHHEAAVNAMLDQVVAWGAALKPLRNKA